ncbi:hypothetical protein PAPYR_6557 [Paratrimastix pyriformis]|uniref:Uncharacterized protein n=1 Tax=Paratrimastix pyriformis TaxID=342808 RepID=A0ABQ8UI64_9EUKA|nr:hypothetical protein PAPYR_6557 [Paratrimastix pyriformis]
MIVEASDYQLLTYLQLLGLSHTTRVNIWGTPRQLSFDDPDFTDDNVIAAIVTPDALAAIVGPCAHLTMLSFPKRTECFSGADGAWVDVAFAGHTQLAILETLMFAALPRILEHLTGLEELTLGAEPHHTNITLLSLLAGAPPSLRILRLVNGVPWMQLDALGCLSLARTITQLDAPRVYWPNPESATGFARLERLCLGPCSGVAFLRPIASRLTHLTLPTTRLDSCALVAELAGMGLCRLVELSLSLLNWNCHDPLACLLAANRDTLGSLALSTDSREDPPPASVLAVLADLPRLTRLQYRENRALKRTDLDAMLAGVLDRLEDLELSSPDLSLSRIASTRLRVLRLGQRIDHPLTVDCPALEVLALPRPVDTDDLVLRCPQLRSLEGLWTGADLSRSAAMPCLTRLTAVAREDDEGKPSDRWLSQLLDNGSMSRLTDLDGPSLPTPAFIHRALGLALTRLTVGLEASAFPLRLPDGLRHLTVTLGRRAGGWLRVEGAGLRTLSMTDGPANAVVTLGCPLLGALYLKIRTLSAIRMDEGLTPPLRSLVIDSPQKGPVERSCPVWLDPGNLVEFLSHPGASRLRRVDLPMLKRAGGWSDGLAEALSRLPRLTDLALQKLPGTPFRLACPQLRRLILREQPRHPYPALVLDCPLLEGGWVPHHPDLVAFLPGTTPRLKSAR